MIINDNAIPINLVGVYVLLASYGLKRDEVSIKLKICGGDVTHILFEYDRYHPLVTGMVEDVLITCDGISMIPAFISINSNDEYFFEDYHKADEIVSKFKEEVIKNRNINMLINRL